MDPPLLDSSALPPDLRDRFEARRLLGRGGFGLVLEVQVRADGRRGALKLVPVEGDGARQARELAAATRVRHPHLLDCLETGVTGEVAYLLLELADESLREVLGDPPRRHLAWDLAVQAVRGVAALHRAGLVHRDLKPENVLVLDGSARVSDLGAAKGGDLATLTATGVILGTPEYMAPEQARGEPAGPATDTFALGLILAEALAGRPPHRDLEPLEVVRRLARDQVDGFPELDRGRPRVAALLPALDPEPGRRPPDLEAWADQLASAGEAPAPERAPGEVTRVLSRRGATTGRRRGTPSAPRPSPATGRGRVLQRLAMTLGLGLVVGVAFLTAPGSRPGRPVEAASARPPAPPARERVALLQRAHELGNERFQAHASLGGYSGDREGGAHLDLAVDELLDARHALSVRRLLAAHQAWMERAVEEPAAPEWHDAQWLGPMSVALALPLAHITSDLHLILGVLPRRRFQGDPLDPARVQRFTQLAPRYRAASQEFRDEVERFFLGVPEPGVAPLVDFTLGRAGVEIEAARGLPYAQALVDHLPEFRDPEWVRGTLEIIARLMNRVPPGETLDCRGRDRILEALHQAMRRTGRPPIGAGWGLREILLQRARLMALCPAEEIPDSLGRGQAVLRDLDAEMRQHPNADLRKAVQDLVPVFARDAVLDPLRRELEAQLAAEPP